MRCGKITLALCVALASCMTMAEVGSAMGPGLRGERGVLLWCRDKANTWERELVRGESPATISGEKIPFGGSLRCYLPWENRWVEADSGVLPDFSRSIVVRVEGSPEIAVAEVRESLAAKDGRAVQDVPYADISARLKADGQVLVIDK